MTMKIREQEDIYLNRDKRTDRKRFIAMLALFAVVLLLEFTIGASFEKQHVKKIISGNINSAMTYFRLPDGAEPMPIRKNRKKQIVYISNSHAKTGGYVTSHLQKLLNSIAPEKIEVMDMAAPGIFAPDMLQRVLMSLDLKPDMIIMSVAYISFSDRMQLSLQAHSARSFFKDAIYPKLSTGFWFRNYDIGVYGNTFVSHLSRLFRYRNDIRDVWERPIVRSLKKLSDDRYILFLEADEDQGWKFPDGYNNNLFQWNLYAIGRDGHLQDLKEAVESSKQAGVPVLGFNLPIHWEKSIYPNNQNDYQSFRKSLKNVFQNASEYVDYQDSFPKEFTTYDALHPTWHGARLHALDIALQLAKRDYFIDPVTPQSIVEKYLESEPAISQDYQESLDGNYPALKTLGFRRYDLSEPANARRLMRRLATLPIGSIMERELLLGLGLRIRYWLEEDFAYTTESEDAYRQAFKRGLRTEISNAKKRMGYFKKRLVEFQTKRLIKAPLPELEEASLISRIKQPIIRNVVLHILRYRLKNGDHAVKVMNQYNRVVAYVVENKHSQSGYQRVDILGDGSFLLIQPLNQQLVLPSWLYQSKPYVRFGI